MEIILMCPGIVSGQAAFSAETIEGIPAPERRYNIVNGKIVLAGFSDAVLHHDADELLKQSIYRMPTPAEQEAMFQEAQQASMAQESNLATFTAQVQRANGDGEAILIASDGSGQGVVPENPDTGVPIPPVDNGEQTSLDSQPPAVDNKKKALGG